MGHLFCLWVAFGDRLWTALQMLKTQLFSMQPIFSINIAMTSRHDIAACVNAAVYTRCNVAAKVDTTVQKNEVG